MARFRDSAAPSPLPVAATAEQPIRVKGGLAFIGLQASMLVALVGIVFKAGGVERQVSVNTQDINQQAKQIGEINVALSRLTALAASSLEGKEVDRATLADVRARLQALEGRR
jgi:hypothetical protein